MTLPTTTPDIRARYNTTREKIAEIRARVNLEETPQYRVAVKETARGITLSREPYSLTFDKKRAMVTEAVIDGVALKGVALPHLLIVDENGKALKQADSTAGDLTVRHEKFSLFLEGFFTVGGHRVPVVYEMDRMTGTTFCTMTVPGPLKVRRLTLEHSLGKTPRPLDVFYAPHHYLRQIKPYKPVVINEHKVDVIFEKDTMMYWTDGHIGLQVYSVTWDGSRVLDAEKKFRYGTGEVRGGASWADLTFFATGTKETIEVPGGYKVTCAFSPMPFKKWRPLSEAASSDAGIPPRVAPGYEPGEEIAAGLKRFGQSGTTLLIHNQPHPCFVPVNPAFTKWHAEEARRNGMRIILYIERSWAQEKAHPESSLLTAEELLAGRQELASHWGPKDDGAARWGTTVTMCCNYEPWRVHLLTMIDYFVGELGFDGAYLDTSFICSCTNPRHGESPDESTAVRGAMVFQQDLRLLLDDYGKKNGRPCTLVNHYWDQHAAPVAGVSDYTLPGEQNSGQMIRKMTPENYLYGYSTLASGVNFIWYSAGTYDLTSPALFNDAAECGGHIWMPLGLFSPELVNHVKYYQPVVQYGLEGTTPIHRYSKEYARVFSGGDAHTRAMMYLKDGSALVYLVNGGPKAAKTSFSFKLHKAWKKCLVLDAAHMAWHVVPVKGGRIAMAGLDCSGGPLPLVVRPLPTEVGVNWLDNQCRSARATLEGGKLTVTATGVAASVGLCYVEVPAGTVLTRPNQPVQKVNDNIYCLRMAFNPKGEGMQVLDVTAAAKPEKVHTGLYGAV